MREAATTTQHLETVVVDVNGDNIAGVINKGGTGGSSLGPHRCSSSAQVAVYQNDILTRQRSYNVGEPYKRTRKRTQSTCVAPAGVSQAVVLRFGYSSSDTVKLQYAAATAAARGSCAHNAHNVHNAHACKSRAHTPLSSMSATDTARTANAVFEIIVGL